MDTEEIEMVRKFPIFRSGRYAGGYLELRYGTRKKPFNQLASRTIGEDRENAQKVGLEGYFDKFLKGPTDKRLMKKIDNSKDIWVPVYDPSEFEIKRGDDIVTTLNVHLQDVVHAELEKQLIKSQASAGTAILMEVKTGAIKAISNLTLKDSTKNISFPAKITVDSSTVAATADFNIDRTLWGMNYKGPGNPQDWFISKTVNLKLTLTAAKK